MDTSATLARSRIWSGWFAAAWSTRWVIALPFWQHHQLPGLVGLCRTPASSFASYPTCTS
jgi:hypothetical protein